MNLNVQVNLTQIHFQEYNHADIVNLMGSVMGKGVYVKEQKNTKHYTAVHPTERDDFPALVCK